MAAGIPIVTTTYGGVPDTVGDTALLVEAGDVAAFGRALRSVLEDAELAERLGTDARRRYVERYTQEEFQRRFVELLRPLLADLVGADTGSR
jgi:glycosyltransferase involved in cell wall biosynthesis